ncbi:hypothetical protein [Dactylosporangium sp. CA-139066]|uniref:hypothetical protein n=1 Tax=Dactylosporangium sp. CA-139066 TaxID=3239930 RepID=UPI003D9275A1
MQLTDAEDSSYEVSFAQSATVLDTVRDSDLGVTKDWSKAAVSATTVAGRPATLSVLGSLIQLRWQPVDGLWAQVIGSGQHPDAAGAARVAAGVRYDTAYRCVLPLHLKSLPAGSHVTGCLLVLRGYDGNDSQRRPNRVNRAQITIADGAKWAVFDFLAAVPAGPEREDRETPSLPAGGPKSLPQLPPGVTVLPTDDLADYHHTFNVDGYNVDGISKGYGRELTLSVGHGLSMRGDGRNPSTWPERLVG